MKKNIILMSLVLLVMFSCQSKPITITSMSATHIELSNVYDKQPDQKMEQMIDHYKTTLDQKMDAVVGTSAQYMTYGRPESLLTNLSSDQMLARVHNQLHQKCDLAMVNVDGHRANMPQGKVTMRDVFEIYSFDNALSIVKIKGEYLKLLFDSYARMGGAGVSANVKLVIKDKKVLKVLIDGKKIDPTKIYTLVTLDYLAGGNDGMSAIRKAESITPTGIILRDCMLDYIKQQTEEGKEISAKLDKRVIVE